MPKAYSLDLRERVLNDCDAVEAGLKELYGGFRSPHFPGFFALAHNGKILYYSGCEQVPTRKIVCSKSWILVPADSSRRESA